MHSGAKEMKVRKTELLSEEKLKYRVGKTEKQSGKQTVENKTRKFSIITRFQ